MTPCFPPTTLGQLSALSVSSHISGHRLSRQRRRRASSSPLLGQVCTCRNRAVHPHSDTCGDSTVSSPLTSLTLVKRAKRPTLRLWLACPGLWDQRPPGAEGLCYWSPSRHVRGEAHASGATEMGWGQKCL